MHIPLPLCLGLLTACSANSPSNQDPTPRAAAPVIAQDSRMQWWREARFGMFIHWDMSSVAGTEISWSRKGSKPLDIFGDKAGYVEDPAYDHLYEKFNPVNFVKNWKTPTKT